jgi:hypothetical protein
VPHAQEPAGDATQHRTTDCRCDIRGARPEHAGRVEPEPQSIPLTWIWPEDPPEPKPKPPQRETPRNPASPNFPRIDVIAPGNGPEAPAAISAITPDDEEPLKPTIDWQQAATRSIKEFLQEEAEREQHGELLDSKPDVLQQPKIKPLPPAVVTERLDNGDMVTRHRINDSLTIVCEHPHMPLALHFDVTARVRPALCHAIDTRKPMSFDPIKPKYLSRPLPKPSTTNPGNR